jgi:hypothetical protein
MKPSSDIDMYSTIDPMCVLHTRYSAPDGAL